MDRQMHFEIIVRQLEDGEILGESLIKEIEVKKPRGNDLDVETLRALEDALREFPGSAVVISHDRW